MKTKNIFKTLAFAMLMPTMLLTTACSSEDDLVNNTATETVANKGYALPVTVNVTRQGDGATRATYTDNGDKTGTLDFSEGDKLFVEANYSDAGQFAGLLDYDDVSEKFSGTIYTESQYTGTAEELLKSASALMATLLPAGYGTYGYLSISNAGAYNADLLVVQNKVCALEKKEAVEQLSFESVDEYNKGFALVPRNAVVCFSISGLTANTAVEVIFKESDDPVPPVNVTTDAEGVATFAVGMPGYANFDYFSLTVDGNAITLPADKMVEAGKIYNMSRIVTPATDLSELPAGDYEAQDGEVLTGTLASNVRISIADGATVTLKNVTITNLGDGCDWAGINCEGDATLVLEGINEVCPGSDGEYSNYPGIYIAEGYTLTIQGAGYLTAYSNAYDPMGAGIGGGYGIPCGNIVINSGNIKAHGGAYAAGIGSGGYGGYCGDITINGGTIMATGGDCAAGIGSGDKSGYCGTITITSGVTSVTAYKGDGSPNSIGAGRDSPAITVTIEDYDKVTQE